MSRSNLKRALTLAMLVLFLGLVAAIGGCTGGQGDTDGGPGNDDSGIGSQPVSNGGFGATLTISLPEGGNELFVAERSDFFVDARDPSGAPLAFQRVFCESEKGIAILEPSSGGVAFEHTNADGRMSGILGGVTPGSFLVECRLEQGFNLVARKTFRVTGEIPPGFQGFPGAAGGNLGGGSIQPNPVSEPRIVTITFSGVGYTDEPNGPIDTFFNNNCDGNFSTNDPEPFGFDDYNVTISNPSTDTFVINSIKFALPSFSIESSEQNVSNEIGAGGSGVISGPFTEFVGFTSTKSFATTGSSLPSVGTYTVTFTVEGETLAGDDFTLTGSTTVQFAAVNRCEE